MADENKSKELEHEDESGFMFAKEMLDGDVTAAINFDRLQYHPVYGYILFEYLNCDEEQPNATPYTSHPNRYWFRNKRKFISLWQAAQAMGAILVLVNYAKAGTLHEDKIKVIRVIELDRDGIKKEESCNCTREIFQAWFRKLNRECLD